MNSSNEYNIRFIEWELKRIEHEIEKKKIHRDESNCLTHIKNMKGIFFFDKNKMNSSDNSMYVLHIEYILPFTMAAFDLALIIYIRCVCNAV